MPVAYHFQGTSVRTSAIRRELAPIDLSEKREKAASVSGSCNADLAMRQTYFECLSL